VSFRSDANRFKLRSHWRCERYINTEDGCDGPEPLRETNWEASSASSSDGMSRGAIVEEVVRLDGCLPDRDRVHEALSKFEPSFELLPRLHMGTGTLESVEPLPRREGAYRGSSFPHSSSILPGLVVLVMVSALGSFFASLRSGSRLNLLRTISSVKSQVPHA
jgi:hypothetical protein